MPPSKKQKEPLKLKVNEVDILLETESLKKYLKSRKREGIFSMNIQGNPGLTNTIPTIESFSNLVDFNCSQNNLTNLSQIRLPENLLFFNCSLNKLRYLPSQFPKNLKEFEASHNRLSSVPSLRNTQLTVCKFSHNQVEVLPELPVTLEEFNCSFNDIRTLSEIEHCRQLKDLDCSHNRLEALPEELFRLPLVLLFCENNNLARLPAQMPPQLRHLICCSNRLKTLPPLKIQCPRMHSLSCRNNELTHLPSLPLPMERLRCGNNRLIMLPEIGEHVWILEILGNPVCNFVPYMDYFLFNTVNGLSFRKSLKAFLKFKETFYFLLCKKKLLAWLWKIRDKIARQRFHPSHLWKFVDTVDDFDNVSLHAWLDQWQ